MLIEHTSRSTEEKPKITLNLINKIYMLWCIMMVNRMLQLAKSQYGQPTRSVTQPSRTTKSVNPKSTLSQSTVNANNNNNKSQRNPVKSQRSTSISTPKMRTREIGILTKIGVSLTLVNAGQIYAETLGQK